MIKQICQDVSKLVGWGRHRGKPSGWVDLGDWWHTKMKMIDEERSQQWSWQHRGDSSTNNHWHHVINTNRQDAGLSKLTINSVSSSSFSCQLWSRYRTFVCLLHTCTMSIYLHPSSSEKLRSPSYQLNCWVTVFISFLLLISQSFFLLKFLAKIRRVLTHDLLICLSIAISRSIYSCFR